MSVLDGEFLSTKVHSILDIKEHDYYMYNISVCIWNSKRLDYQITPFGNRDIKWCIFGHTAQNASVM